MSYISAFDPSADKKRNLASKIYDISESVTKFFWDDAPRLGIQQREGQQDMAFDVLDAIKSGSHVVIEAGVGKVLPIWCPFCFTMPKPFLQS